MNNNKKYIRYTWFLFTMVFMVILAGGIVRMTQSGMGCPDWPKCFGRWIPPTNAGQLPPDFEKYLKAQDIDHSFNVYHTWIEYINRLLGALLGFFILIHFAWSFLKFRKKNRQIIWISFLLLIAIGFQGWLGKKVVDANLAAVKVTAHMLVALLIAALPMLIIYKLKEEGKIQDKLLKKISVVVLLILLIQIVLGTQVREKVDEISKSLNYSQRELWIGSLNKIFIVHRSFSWVVLLGCLLLACKARAYSAMRKNILFILSLVIITILLGITMAWFHIPALAQPFHLLLASILTIALFVFILRLE